MHNAVVVLVHGDAIQAVAHNRTRAERYLGLRLDFARLHEIEVLRGDVCILCCEFSDRA
jgi:hypothetical protein